MYIITFEFISIFISLGIDLYSKSNVLKNIHKIDKVLLRELKNKMFGEEKNYTNKILEDILLCVPGVNLIKASVNAIKLQKYLESLCTTTTITLFNEPLPLDYTLDEVKELNELLTTYSYRIGKIDGKNIAIIGVKETDDSPIITRIKFTNEDYNITHTYENMTEEEAQYKTFTVYPLTTAYSLPQVANSEIQKAMEYIEQSRIENAVKANLEELKVQSISEQKIIPVETEQISLEEQKEPILVKKMYHKPIK